jgi:hypothetical protein
MTMFRRRDAIRVLTLGVVLLLPAMAKAQQAPASVAQLADAYGLQSWGKIEAIRYTFNAQLPGIELARSWVWEPKTERISYDGKDKSGKPVKVVYLRSQLASQPDDVKAIDASFQNDQYWLVLPFHVTWDGAVVTDEGQQKLPLGDGSARKITVKYSDSGYSPGDTWDLYVGADSRVQEMVYHRGGTAKPALVTVKWTDHKKAGPLLVALDHRGTADGKPVRVTFSNVAVKLAGSDSWVEAQ